MFVLILMLGCSSSSLRQSPQKTNTPPNIVLVMADDQGWGDMGYYDHPVLQTPHFDEMAATALRFDRFYAAAPVCSPTRGSVMTGRTPNRFACFTWGRTLRPQEITIAEVMQQSGYVTGHFGKWHLGSVRIGSPVNPGASGFDEWFSAPNFFDNSPIMSREGIAQETEGESSMVTVDAALEFIHKHEEGDQPYFAVVWFGSPHGPHEAYEEDRRLYEGEDEKLQHFYGEITGMDRAFGKLRNALKALPSYSNTILWYCSDNGGLPNLGITGGRGRKGHIYEGGLRVPAILEWPAKIKETSVSNLPATTSDMFPTLAEVVGYVLPEDRPYDGISLMPLIEGQMTERAEPIGFWQYPAKGIRTPSFEWMPELLAAQQEGNMIGDSMKLRLEDIRIIPYPTDHMPGHSAWLDWPWKLHRIEKNKQINWELYRLDMDPEEKKDLHSEESERAREMKLALETWQESVLHSLNGGDY
ncbi:MAG: sulfatase-like hydrolase/transferase [Bacteroidota bacterium]